MKKKYGYYVIVIFMYFLTGLTCLFSADSGIDVGNKSIDFSLNEISSTTTFKLSKYNGKNPVLINFFATWCPYCVQEIPELNKVYTEYNKKGLIVAAVNVQEKNEKVASFIKKKKVLYKILLDSNGEVSKKFKVFGLPTNILINSKGVIVFRGNNMPSKEDIEKILSSKKKK